MSQRLQALSKAQAEAELYGGAEELAPVVIVVGLVHMINLLLVGDVDVTSVSWLTRNEKIVLTNHRWLSGPFQEAMPRCKAQGDPRKQS